MFRASVTLIALLTLLPALASAAPAPLSLTAVLEKTACPLMQSMVLTLTLHNSGLQNLTIGGSAFEQSSFHMVVTDEAGRSVPRTADGERVLTPPTAVSANATVRLNSGQSLRYRFNLARLFDLSRAGVYTVTVSRRFRPWVLPRPAVDAPAQEIVLSAGPLKFQMEEDAAAKSGPTAYAPPPSHQSFIYTVGPGADGISHYRVGEDGSLSFSLAYSRLSSPCVPQETNSLVTTPDGRFLYAGSAGDNTISQFRIGENGVLFPLSPSTVPAQKFPGLLLMDPHGQFLYALSNWGNTLYAIDKDGRLTTTALMPSEAWAKERIHTVVPSDFGLINSMGNILYACNGQVFGYRLAPDGTVTALSPLGDGMAAVDGGRVNAIALSPSGTFAFVGVSTTLSSAFFDKVLPTRIQTDGTLTPIPNAAQTPPATPLPSPGFQPFLCTALAVDPTGRFLLVVNQGYLDCYRIGPDGTLTFLSLTPYKGDMISVFFGPVGHLVYALNRNPAPLTAFRLDEEHGLVSSGLDMSDGLSFDASMASAVAPTPLKQGPVSGGVQMSAALPADVLPAAAPVVLTVILKNVTKHPIKLGAAGTDMASFRLSLIGPQRQLPGSLTGDGEPLVTAVPLLAAGHDLLDAPGLSAVPIILLPGGQRQYRFVLSRLADMTVAGHYTVQITCVIPGGVKVASPLMPFLLDGPFNGITRSENGSVLAVL